MAELSTEEGGGGKGKHTKKRAKKSSTKVDMTPMVDLAFLLLTFFMLATTFSKPKTLEITFPKPKTDPTAEGTKIPDELANTFLIGESTDTIYYYQGRFKPDTTQLEEVLMGKDGLRKLLLKVNSRINTQVKDLEARYKRGEIDEENFKAMRSKAKGVDEAPFVIVKTAKKAKYGTVIDVIDELNISNIGKYAVVDVSDAELVALLTKTRPGSFTLQ